MPFLLSADHARLGHGARGARLGPAGPAQDEAGPASADTWSGSSPGSTGRRRGGSTARARAEAPFHAPMVLLDCLGATPGIQDRTRTGPLVAAARAAITRAA